MSTLSEFDIISLLNTRSSSPQLIRGIGDDAAVFGNPKDPLKWVITQDLLSEDIHFRLKWISPADLAYKSIAVNLSDLAAMGATPKFVLLSMGIPKTIPDSFIRRFSRAFLKTCHDQEIILIGGDTCDSQNGLWIQVTALGQAPARQILYRHGATPGDLIFISGPLGASSLGLHLLTKKKRSALAKRHHRPPIRTAFAQALAKRGFASAMTDISDGFLFNLETMCGTTLCAAIDVDRLPIDALTQREANRHTIDPLPFALGGGEDYELLFTVPPKKAPAFKRWCHAHHYTAHELGQMSKHSPRRHSPVRLFTASGEELPTKGLVKGYVAR